MTLVMRLDKNQYRLINSHKVKSSMMNTKRGKKEVQSKGDMGL